MPTESIEQRLTRIEALAERGLKPSAAQLSRLILEKSPGNVDALVWLARTSSLPDEVEKALRQAAALQPGHPGVQQLLAARQPQQLEPSGLSGSYNPFNNVPNYNQPPPAQPAYANPTAGYQAPPASYQTSPAANPYQPAPPPASSSFEYLRNLAATNNPVAPVSPVIVEPSRTLKVGGVQPVAVIFGLLLLLAGLALAVLWTLSLIDYNSDLAKSTQPVQAQITDMAANGSASFIKADVKNLGKREYKISEQMYKTIEPLVRDQKNNAALAANSITLNVTPGGRLVSVDVQTPNKGSAQNSNSLLGFGQAVDWSFTILGVVMALIGMILIGRALNKPRSA